MTPRLRALQSLQFFFAAFLLIFSPVLSSNAQQPPTPRFLGAHEADIRDIVFSPDGRLLATTTVNGVEVRDMASGDVVHSFAGYCIGFPGASFSPGNRYLATCEHDMVVVYELSSEKRIWSTPVLPGRSAVAVSFSPDGKWLAGSNVPADSEPKFIKIWKTSTWELVRTISGIPGHMARQIAFTPDSKLILSASGSTWAASEEIKLWNVESGEVVRSWKAEAGLKSASVSPDGQYIATLDANRKVEIRKTLTGELVQRLPYVSENYLYGVRLTFADKGTLAVSMEGAHNSGTDVRIWDAVSGKLLFTLDFKTGVYGLVAISPDNRWLAIDCKRSNGSAKAYSVALWDLAALRSGTPTLWSYAAPFSLDQQSAASSSSPTEVAESSAPSAPSPRDSQNWQLVGSPTIQRLTTKPEGATSLERLRKHFQYLQISAKLKNDSATAQPIISPSGSIYLSRGPDSYSLQDMIWPAKKEMAGLIQMLKGGELNLKGPGYTFRLESRGGNESAVLSINPGATVEVAFLFQVPEDVPDNQLQFHFTSGLTVALAGPAGPTVLAATAPVAADSNARLAAMYRSNLQRTGAEPNKPIERTPTLRWKFKSGPVVSTPLIAGDAVYVGSRNGKFHAIELASGKLRWTSEIRSPIYGSPAIAEGKVLVPSDNGTVHALEIKDGRETWRFNSPPNVKIWASPAVLDGVVYIGTLGGQMYLLDLQTGQSRNKIEFYAPISSPVALSRDAVYVMTWDKTLFAVKPDFSGERWKADTGSYFSLDRYLNLIPSSPVVGENAIYAVEIPADITSGGAVAFDKETGKKLWSFKPPHTEETRKRLEKWMKESGGPGVEVIRRGEEVLTLYISGQARKYTIYAAERVSSSPALAAGTVIHGCDDGNVYALDAASGKQKWFFATKGRIYSSPTIAGGIVYVGSNDGNLYALDLNTGEQRWQFTTSKPIVASPVTADGVVVFGSMDGNVYALQQ